jgi:hypothetical protein
MKITGKKIIKLSQTEMDILSAAAKIFSDLYDEIGSDYADWSFDLDELSEYILLARGDGEYIIDYDEQ